MITVLRTVGWVVMMLLILPAIMPVLIIFVIRKYSEYVKNPTCIDEGKDRIKEYADKILKYGLIPVCILGAISIKALGIYMLIGSIVGVFLLYYVIIKIRENVK